MDYSEQIKHPRWQRKRAAVLLQHDFQCQACGDRDNTLHVHHPFYYSGAKIWDYDTEELQCLCFKCHSDWHERHSIVVRERKYTFPTGEQQYYDRDYMPGPDVTPEEEMRRFDAYYEFCQRMFNDADDSNDFREAI